MCICLVLPEKFSEGSSLDIYSYAPYSNAFPITEYISAGLHILRNSIRSLSIHTCIFSIGITSLRRNNLSVPRLVSLPYLRKPSQYFFPMSVPEVENLKLKIPSNFMSLHTANYPPLPNTMTSVLSHISDFTSKTLL